MDEGPKEGGGAAFRVERKHKILKIMICSFFFFDIVGMGGLYCLI